MQAASVRWSEKENQAPGHKISRAVGVEISCQTSSSSIASEDFSCQTDVSCFQCDAVCQTDFSEPEQPQTCEKFCQTEGENERETVADFPIEDSNSDNYDLADASELIDLSSAELIEPLNDIQEIPSYDSDLHSTVEECLLRRGHDLKTLTPDSLLVNSSPVVLTTTEVLQQLENVCLCCGEKCPDTEEFNCNKCGESASSPNQKLKTPGRGRSKGYLNNFVAIVFLICGEYYKDYEHILGTLGVERFSERQFIRVIQWIAPIVEKLSVWSVQSCREIIRSRGQQNDLGINFDGFYLTRGHHSNNSSATVHDMDTGNIIGYSHRTKQGKKANWQGTSGGAEGDMMRELVKDLLDNNFKITKAVLDKDASCQDMLLTLSPETEIIFCSNHVSKTFHLDLEKVKKVPCRVST